LRMIRTAGAVFASLAACQLHAEARPIRVGLVTGDSQEQVTRVFGPFTDYLNAEIPGSTFEVVRMASIEELLQSAGQNRIEFAFCTASAMVELNVRLGARAVATVLSPTPGTPPGATPWTGSAVFVRRDSGIRRLADAAGKRVIGLSPLALGGWLAAVREWRRLGVNERSGFKSVEFQFSYEGVADRVCSGGADVGVLAGSALASVTGRCAGGFRVLPPEQSGGKAPAFPVSTRLYPETAFAAMGGVDEELATGVIVALLSMPHNGEAARAAYLAGFSAPLSYAPVQQLMEDLRVRPFENYGQMTPSEEMARHMQAIAGTMAAFVLVLLIAWRRLRRLYEDLKNSESVRHRVFDESRIAMGVLDPENWTFVDCNPAAVRIYGWSSRDDLRGRSIRVVSTPEQYAGEESVAKAARQLVEAGNGREAVFEWRHQRPDGEIWDAEIHVTGFRAQGKRLLQYTVQDVTVSRQLKRRVELLAKALHSAKECIVIGDAEDRIVYANQAFTDVYGYTEEDMMGRSILLVNSPRNAPHARDGLLEATLAGGWRGELWNRTKSGRDILVDLSTAAVCGEDGRVVATIGCARDITEYKSLQEEYFRARKMEGIGRLAGGIAHDFSNLLTLINGGCSRALQKMGPADAATPNVIAIQEAGARAAALTRQLLMFTKQRPVPLKPLALDRVVADAEPLLRRISGDGVALTVILGGRPGEKPWLVTADESMLGQVLMNLAVNSSQAMPGGGSLEIATENLTLSGSGSQPAGDYVVLRVSDTGCGMDEETQSHIFEPFFTTKGEDGTGLGLATVYGIVQQCGGQIHVASAAGEGTTFRIQFPRTTAEG